jgi:Spy/CpxP family protein refolding chaperone
MTFAISTSRFHTIAVHRTLPHNQNTVRQRGRVRHKIQRTPLQRFAWHATIATISLSSIVSAQSAVRRTPWWQSESIRQTLKLSPQQCVRLNAIFESTLEARRQLRQRLDELEHQLDEPTTATLTDQQATALIARVETARLQRNVARAVMLYKMRQVLTADQRERLDLRISRDAFTSPR